MTDINYHGPVVAFDLDDTLLRERDFCRSGFRFLLNTYIKPYLESSNETGMPESSTFTADSLFNTMDAELSAGRNPFKPYENALQYLSEAKGIQWNLQAHIEDYRSHIPSGLKLTDGAEETLQKLSESGIRMALITDGRSATQRRKIEALQLERFIAPDLLLISGETGFEKLESKEMFSMVVRSFPEAKAFYYVGNNPRKDFYYPNLMGWTTLQVPEHPDDVHKGIQPPSPLHAPQLMLATFQDLLHYVS